MITCKTLEEAQAVEGVFHIDREDEYKWIAYQAGDALPEHLTDGLTDEERAAKAKGK